MTDLLSRLRSDFRAGGSREASARLFTNLLFASDDAELVRDIHLRIDNERLHRGYCVECLQAYLVLLRERKPYPRGPRRRWETRLQAEVRRLKEPAS